RKPAGVAFDVAAEAAGTGRLTARAWGVARPAVGPSCADVVCSAIAHGRPVGCGGFGPCDSACSPCGGASCAPCDSGSCGVYSPAGGSSPTPVPNDKWQKKDRTYAPPEPGLG